jgi:hypothetical protein
MDTPSALGSTSVSDALAAFENHVNHFIHVTHAFRAARAGEDPGLPTQRRNRSYA